MKESRIPDMEMINHLSVYRHLMLNQSRCQDVASAGHLWSNVSRLQGRHAGLPKYNRSRKGQAFKACYRDNVYHNMNDEHKMVP